MNIVICWFYVIYIRKLRVLIFDNRASGSDLFAAAYPITDVIINKGKSSIAITIVIINNVLHL